MPGASSRPGEPSPGCGTGNNPGRAGHNPMSRSDAGPTRSVDSACTVTAFPRRCHGISSHVFPLNFPGGDRGPDSRAGCLKVGLPPTWPPAGKVSHRRCRTLREERSPHGPVPKGDSGQGSPRGIVPRRWAVFNFENRRFRRGLSVAGRAALPEGAGRPCHPHPPLGLVLVEALIGLNSALQRMIFPG